MKPITFLKAKQVIKSPIPFIPFSKLTKKPTKAFFLNLSSDFNFTSSAKSKDNTITEPNNSKIHHSNVYSVEMQTNSLCISNKEKSHMNRHTHNSRLETKDSTGNKAFQQIAEENLSDSSLTEKSISFSAFIIPTQTQEECEQVKTFSSICKNIDLSDKNKNKTIKELYVKRRVKTSEEIELERIIQERKKYKQLRITNNIMIDKIKNNTTAYMQQSTKHKIIPKPFKLNVDRNAMWKRNVNCCLGCFASSIQKKTGGQVTKVDTKVSNTVKYNSNKVKSNKGQTRNRSKLISSFNTKGYLTQR